MLRKSRYHWFAAAAVTALMAGSLPAITSPATAARVVPAQAGPPAVTAACRSAQQAYAAAKHAYKELEGNIAQTAQDQLATKAETDRVLAELSADQMKGADLATSIAADNDVAESYLDDAIKKILKDIIEKPLDETKDAVLEQIVVKVKRAVSQIRRARTNIASGLWKTASIFEREAWAESTLAFYEIVAEPAIAQIVTLAVSIEIGKAATLALKLAADDLRMFALLEDIASKQVDLAELQDLARKLDRQLDFLLGQVGDAVQAIDDAKQQVDQACHPTAPGGTLGTTWGDPHLVTFDGAHYDFQQVGEFVLARSNRDNFEIQVRERPWGGTSVTIAENSAVAFRVGRHRVGIYVETSGIETLVDGKVVKPISNVPYSLSGGGNITNQAWSSNEIVSWPDGAYVVVDYSGGHYLALDISVPLTEAGHLSGLLGNDDGKPNNDITTRGGQTLPYPPTTQELYGPFSASWRITQTESLFDYGPGQSTKTFTDLTFPRQIVSVGALPPSARQSAIAECEAAGVTTEPYLDACVLDVVLTGDPSTAAAASGSQSFKGQPEGAMTLTPAAAGPDIAGNSQALRVTATTTNGAPLTGMPVTLRITGANPATLHAKTDRSGSASFSYVGHAAGTDSAVATIQLGQILISSQPSTIFWIKPQAAISTTEVKGAFFANPSDTEDFEAVPADHPAITEVFPTIDFNPPSGSIGNPPPNFAVNPNTRPFTDVTLDNHGNFTGTILVQGPNATEQAGANDLFNFYAEFTGSLIVAKPGNFTFDFFSDDGFFIGVGNGASYVSGVDINPPASGKTPFKGYRVVASFNQGAAPTGNTATVNFPKAGVYPFELDYTECCGGQLSMTMANGNGLGLPPGGNLALSPPSPGPDSTGTSQAFTVSVVDASGDALAGRPVTLTITGANPRTLTAKTNRAGVAKFSYVGAHAGVDQLQASAKVTNGPEISNVASLTWTAPAA